MSRNRVNTISARELSADAPSVAMRRSPNGLFVDFHLMGEMLRRKAQWRDREDAEAAWRLFLTSKGYNDDLWRLDNDGGDSAESLASDAWHLANVTGLVMETGLTDAGHRIANGSSDLIETLAQGLSRYLVGQGGTAIVALLQAGAATLAESDHPWVRFCPGLLPLEMGAIVHWACIDTRKCRELLDNLVIWRDVAMHHHGWPNPKNTKAENAATHYDATVDFYLSHPWLAERTPMSFGEEFAMVKLLDYCGLLEEKSLGTFMPYLVPPD